MKLQNKLLSLLTVTTIALAAVSPAMASSEGGAGPGGGNVVRKQLFDFYENNTVSVDRELLQPALDNAKLVLAPLAELIPQFPQALSDSLETKNIIFDSKVMNAKECFNSGSFFQVGKQVVACQNSFEVRIQREIFKSLDLKNRTGLIIHEALLAYRLVPYENGDGDWKADRAGVEAEIRELNRRIFNGAFKSVADANRQLKQLGFGSGWSSKDELEAHALLRQTYVSKMCSEDKKILLTRPELAEIRNKAYSEMNSGDHTPLMRNAWELIFNKAYLIEKHWSCE